jgi:Dolichyl-phosphate-mannose-protein mannosyltransferase
VKSRRALAAAEPGPATAPDSALPLNYGDPDTIPIPVVSVPVISTVSVPVIPAGSALAIPAGSALAIPAVSAPTVARRIRSWLLFPGLPLTAIMGLAVFLRLWQLTAVGFNSDEAVYTGSASAIAGNHTLTAMFPVFRAHPLLFQTLLSLALRIHDTDWTARAFAAAIGVATVGVTYLLGRRLYGIGAGLIAALLLAVMPYHVVVSRQVLLDGLMTACATAALYCVVRYVESGRLSWLLAGGSMMGAAVLSKETSIVLLGGLYAFFVLTPSARMRARHLLLTFLLLVTEIAVWPVMVRLSGHSRTGQSYLLWQIFRRPNHSAWFYFTVLPAWIGPALLAAVLAGLIWLRKEATWRERLLLAWLIVPVLFLSLWPLKGFEYLLPVSPPLAVLAGRTLARPLSRPEWLGRRPGWLRWPGTLAKPGWITRPQALPRAAMGVLAAATAVSMAIPAWQRIEPSASASFLAGSGGMNGGREAGDWVLHNIPQGARLLAIGPSVANVLEFYGHHQVSALSISPDPRNRNPTYSPVSNPDLALRRGEFQYVVWDAYTADRSAFFANQARRLALKYHGVAVYTSTVSVRASSGPEVVEPVIIIYEVHP